MNKILFCLMLLVITGCDSEEESNRIRIVCTTGMIGDAAKALIGDSADIEVLMGPGVDPHLYKATQGDISNLSSANVIIYNGLHLEGKMGEIFEKLKQRKTVIAIAETLPTEDLINSTDYQGAHDPHIWFDVGIWAKAIANLTEELVKLYPEWESWIRRNSQNYLDELMVLDNFCRNMVSQIPENQRVMITAHDAFKYFGRAYNIEVKGLQGISTTAEYGLRDISDLVTYITNNEIRAIFVESSVPRRSIMAVVEGCRQRGHDLQLGGELFSDAMGEAGTEKGTYIGMVRHNVKTIVHALR